MGFPSKYSILALLVFLFMLGVTRAAPVTITISRSLSESSRDVGSAKLARDAPDTRTFEERLAELTKLRLEYLKTTYDPLDGADDKEMEKEASREVLGKIEALAASSLRGGTSREVEAFRELVEWARREKMAWEDGKERRSRRGLSHDRI